MRYLWDTNTAIYYLQKQFPENAERYIDELLRNERPVLSVITEIELLCWKTATEKDLELLHSFINDAFVIELEQAVKYKTADLRKVHRIKLPDAIIAATAIVHNLTLISRNAKDFQNIQDLKFVDPFEQPT